MFGTQPNGNIPFGDCTFSDSNGNPHTSAMDAALANYSTARGQYTDSATGKVFGSERELKQYQLECEQRGYHF